MPPQEHVWRALSILLGKQVRPLFPLARLMVCSTSESIILLRRKPSEPQVLLSRVPQHDALSSVATLQPLSFFLSCKSDRREEHFHFLYRMECGGTGTPCGE